MSTGFLFPGQGSQRLGMLADVPLSYRERCQKATGYLLVETPENYQDTVFIQLALLIKAAYYVDELQQAGVTPDLVAGHSIGAFCAALACGSLTFEQAALLVYQRATYMKEAYPKGYGMAVVVGMTRKEAEELVDTTFDPLQPVYLSNENCPMQHTLSGSLVGLEQTLRQAKRYHPQKAQLLKVPVPSHCVLMDDTVTRFTAAMKTAVLRPPCCPYLKNTDGRLTDDVEEIRQDLLTNIAHPVQWNRMMDVASEIGMDLAIEFPPGNTLTKLIAAKFGKEGPIRTINLDQYGSDDAVFLYQKWR